MRRIIGIGVGCAIGAAAMHITAAPAGAAPTVTWLGSLDGEGSGGASMAYGVSPDGGTVVGGADSDAPSGHSAFRWTAAGGMTALPSPIAATATATTNGGAFIAGWETIFNNVWGRYWVNGASPPDGGGISPVPGGRPLRTFIHGISNDGSISVGESDGGLTVGPVAMRWTSATGPVALPKLTAGATTNSANAISGDGSVIVGVSQNAAAFRRDVAVRWTGPDHTNVSEIGDLPGGSVTSWASGVSPDGSIIVGSSSSAASGESRSEAFRWTEAGGMQPLGLLGREHSHALDVSADGSVIVGSSSWGAFIWTQAQGTMDLRTYLMDAGVDVGTWSFDVAQGVSDDGFTIVGTGRRASGNNPEAFVVSVPEPASLAGALSLTLLLRRRGRRRDRATSPRGNP